MLDSVLSCFFLLVLAAVLTVRLCVWHLRRRGSWRYD